MKNIFKLIAIFAIAMSGFAFGQTKATVTTQTDLYKSKMVELVNLAKPYYKSGMTYDGFIKSCGGLPTGGFTAQETALMKETYSYLAKGSTDSEIYSATTGATLKEAAQANAFQNQAVNLTAKDPKCNFWCQIAMKIIQVIINAILGN